MKRTLTVMLVVLVVVLAAAGIASAQTPPPITTSGEVPAGATIPVTVNAWMLPDMNAAAGPDIDLIAPYEDAPDSGPVNVTPNLFNTPERYMGFWAIMSSPAGVGSITDVWVDVFHPDGTHKYQHHMTLQSCDSLGTPTTAGSPAAGAVTTLQKTAADFTAPDSGILDQCGQGQLAVYKTTGEISKDQPFGLYTYNIGASSNTGSSVSTPYQFFVRQNAGLATDFSAVNFGQIVPTSAKVTDGDAVWGNSLPTIASVGNVWLNLVADFDPMVGTGPLNNGKLIDVFDIVLGKPTAAENPLGQPKTQIDPIIVNAGTATNDAVTVPFILPANCPTKIQFSIHPETYQPGTLRYASGQTGLPSGPYSGQLKLTAVSSSAQWTTGWQTALAACHFDIPRP